MASLTSIGADKAVKTLDFKRSLEKTTQEQDKTGLSFFEKLEEPQKDPTTALPTPPTPEEIRLARASKPVFSDAKDLEIITQTFKNEFLKNRFLAAFEKVPQTHRASLIKAIQTLQSKGLEAPTTKLLEILLEIEPKKLTAVVGATCEFWSEYTYTDQLSAWGKLPLERIPEIIEFMRPYSSESDIAKTVLAIAEFGPDLELISKNLLSLKKYFSIEEDDLPLITWLAQFSSENQEGIRLACDWPLGRNSKSGWRSCEVLSLLTLFPEYPYPKALPKVAAGMNLLSKHFGCSINEGQILIFTKELLSVHPDRIEEAAAKIAQIPFKKTEMPDDKKLCIRAPGKYFDASVMSKKTQDAIAKNALAYQDNPCLKTAFELALSFDSDWDENEILKKQIKLFKRHSALSPKEQCERFLDKLIEPKVDLYFSLIEESFKQECKSAIISIAQEYIALAQKLSFLPKVTSNLVWIYANLGIAESSFGLSHLAAKSFEQAASLQDEKMLGKFLKSKFWAMLSDTKATPTNIAKIIGQWSKQITQGIKPLIPKDDLDKSPTRPLRIGYLSDGFGKNAVASFVWKILEHHSKKNFEVFAYHFGQWDAVTAELSKLCNLQHFKQQEANIIAAKIQEDNIDILIDLSGIAVQIGNQVAAHRPAPIQIFALASPCTSGSTCFDYRLTCASAEPSDAKEHFTEELVYLPDTLWLYKPLESIPASSRAKEPPSVRNGYVTYGSIQPGGKINPDVLKVWAKILKKDPSSKILLKFYMHAPSDWEFYKKILAEHGIEPDRVIFGGNLSGVSYLEGLELHNHIDVMLDTWPYNSTTTLCDALYMGVPVIVKKGDRHSAMVGESIVGHTLQLDKELVAKDEDEYVEKAIALGKHQELRKKYRQELPQIMEKSPLMDAELYMRGGGSKKDQGYEGALRKIWQKFVGDKTSEK